jgi:hypothetical protein
MSVYSNFLRKLQVFGALFGAKATKLSGIRDKDNQLTDTIDFTSPDLITLTYPVPEFFKENTYFRVKNGGGPNQDVLFKVKSVSGNVITVDDTNTVTSFGPTLCTLDARIAVVQDNPLISKLNTEGNTIFNVSNGALTSGIIADVGLVLAEHYHDDGADVPEFVYVQPFTISDWFVTDGGNTYSIDIQHGLSVTYPDVTVFEAPDDEVVTLHKWRPLDPNIVRLTVSKAGADARFDGTVRVEKS